jgi:hypothetical protein
MSNPQGITGSPTKPRRTSYGNGDNPRGRGLAPWLVKAPSQATLSPRERASAKNVSDNGPLLWGEGGDPAVAGEPGEGSLSLYLSTLASNSTNFCSRSPWLSPSCFSMT